MITITPKQTYRDGKIGIRVTIKIEDGGAIVYSRDGIECMGSMRDLVEHYKFIFESSQRVISTRDNPRNHS